MQKKENESLSGFFEEIFAKNIVIFVEKLLQNWSFVTDVKRSTASPLLAQEKSIPFGGFTPRTPMMDYYTCAPPIIILSGVFPHPL